MAGITGQGQTYNLPNYHGELFAITPSDTPFLSAIGGLSGGKKAESTQFEWQGYDLRAAAQPAVLEGANAPAAGERVRANVTNVVQIHQEAIEVSYTKQSATQQYNGINIGAIDNPAANEMNWQTEQMLKQIARDVEYSFLNGTYQLPTDNTTARKTRGLRAAIATNVIALASTPELTTDNVDVLLQTVWDNGGIQESDTATLIVNSIQKRKLSKAYKVTNNYFEQSRTIAGVHVDTIQTDFGTLNVMLNRFASQSEVVVSSLEQCMPVFLEVPEKGFLFVEPLAKVGSAERSQIYGEIGLEYGNEKAHGKITGLSVA